MMQRAMSKRDRRKEIGIVPFTAIVGKQLLDNKWSDVPVGEEGTQSRHAQHQESAQQPTRRGSGVTTQSQQAENAVPPTVENHRSNTCSLVECEDTYVVMSGKYKGQQRVAQRKCLICGDWKSKKYHHTKLLCSGDGCVGIRICHPKSGRNCFTRHLRNVGGRGAALARNVS